MWLADAVGGWEADNPPETYRVVMMGMCENFLTAIGTLLQGVFLCVQSENVKYMMLTFQMQHECMDNFQAEGHILDHYCAFEDTK